MVLEYHYNGIVWAILWKPNKAIDIGEYSICGGGQLERFYCSSILPEATLLHTHIMPSQLHHTTQRVRAVV